MLISIKQRHQNRRTTQRLKYFETVQEQPRRASCCCENCGKLTQFQQIYKNSPLVVQQHQLNNDQKSLLFKSKCYKKMISTSFHISNKISIQIKKRRHSCTCKECGQETLFQMTSCSKIPARQPMKSAHFKSFIIKKSLGKVFQEFQGAKKSNPLLTSRSHKDILTKSPLLTNRVKAGSCLLAIQNSDSFKYQNKVNKQLMEQKRCKIINSQEKVKIFINKHENKNPKIRLKTLIN
ncbi:unnamed protein product [Paramecium sonneborni]|uniref:Uncharacterized protein n=1 Tax=Paramecium sonneborni TaxID=65129 RepID=A0A8S1QRZ8_9CILI|nr:unnamed protein product [Paramecium sonneborni]